MEMKDAITIDAPREAVWQALNSATILKECVPGCEELTGSPDEGFDAVVTQKIGPVKARFKGRIELSDIIQQESYTITGEGKGGAAGFAKGGAKIRLEDDGAGTRLSYEVEARVGGKLASLGSRLIDGFARKLAAEFFQRFAEQVAPKEAAAEPESPKDEPKKGWIKKMLS